MFGLRKHGSGGWRAAYGTDLKPQPWKRCHPPCFRRVIGPAKALYRNPFSASRRAEKKKKQKETRRSPAPAPTSWAGPFSPAPGFGSRHNIQAVGGAKPQKRLSETHGCGHAFFQARQRHVRGLRFAPAGARSTHGYAPSRLRRCLFGGRSFSHSRKACHWKEPLRNDYITSTLLRNMALSNLSSGKRQICLLAPSGRP